jgi:amino acid adenylation domain-containing protein
LVLEFLVNNTRLIGVRAYYEERAIPRFDVMHLLAHLEQSIRTLIAPSKQGLKLGDIDLFSESDLSTLRAWNPKPPRERCQRTLLDLFLEKVKAQPGRDAVYTTGLTLSYEQLDRYSSLAARTIAKRVGTPPAEGGGPTPFAMAVCYEKSIWAIVSILAVMKLGAAYVPLDPSSPDSRLAMILDDVKASTIICSPKQARRFSDRSSHTSVISVSGDSIQDQEQACKGEAGPQFSARSADAVTPDSLAYIFFTSGSTGRPKGVLVPHSAICTSILAFSPVVRLSPHSRVLQFSSFCFDASVGEIFATLAAGGCICLPDDEERLADVGRFMNESRCNWAFLTPVTLRVINPDDVPLLRVLVVGGEPLPPSLFKTWAARPDRLQLMEAYGPTECCVFSTMNTHVTPDTHPQDMGFALGGTTWIVDPHDHHTLAPVGCVGELVISGNTVAAGYLNLPAHSSTSGFLEKSPPRWAAMFPEHAVGQQRMYRTGDLVRFNRDGSIRYVARMDNQVSLRGMRVELGEIEYHLARSAAGDKAAPVVVVAKMPNMNMPNGTENDGSKHKTFLACFFVVELAGSGKIAPEPLRMTKQRRELVRSVVLYMQDKVPLHMIPTVFVPLPGFPENTSGKVERRVLVEDILGGFDDDDFKHYGVSVTTRHPNDDDSSATRPMTANEQRLQQVWSRLLGVDASVIKPDDSFLRLGGDSVDVIRMVTMLRQEGWHLSPVETMSDPRLSSVASKMTMATRQTVTPEVGRTAPFSLLRHLPGTLELNVERLASLAARKCSVAREMIENIYPCTALQEGLLSISEKVPGSYFYRQAWSIDEGVDLDRLVAAYRGLCKAHPILRTRFIRDEDDSAYQVVLREDLQVMSVASDVTGAAACRRPVSLVGKPLHWVSVNVPTTAGGPDCSTQFVRTMHHALYDAWSLVNLETELAERYMAGEAFVPPKVTDYAQFIKYITEEDPNLADEYWKEYLDGARQTLWPSVPAGHHPQTNVCIKRTFQLEWSKSHTKMHDYTKAAVARLAWAILLAKHSMDTDVTFGLALSGRDAPVDGIEQMTGPTNLTIPVRYRLSDSSNSRAAPSIADVLEAAQGQTRDTNRFQHRGMQNIARLSPEARASCDFRSLLVIQPARQLQQWAESRNKILREVLDEGMALVHPYPLIVELCFQNHSDDVGVWVHYDDRLLSGPQVDLIVRQLQKALQELVSSDPSTRIDAIDLNDEISLGYMKRFHEDTCNPAVESGPSSIVSLVSQQVTLNPNAPAVSAWDGEMTYAELDTMASHLGTYLRETLKLTPESTTAVCFEKSIWAIVAMLAIMKAGGAYAPIDPSAPDSYKGVLLNQIASEAQGGLVLVSEEQSASMQQQAHQTKTQLVIITHSMVASLAPSPGGLNMASPGSPAYVLFTSGSTGVPKGVIMEHRSASASILAHGAECKFSPSTRALQFAAFTFDASIMEIWTTLAFGGCVCMPSESQRVNDLERYMQASEVTWAFLTPTVSGLVRKERVAGSLSTLVLGGEALTRGNIQKWTSPTTIATAHGPGANNLNNNTGHSLELMNGYGPTECCVFACVNTKVTQATDPRDVGSPVAGVSAWIVDPNDHNRLMPLTCPGELVITGPTLARGYLGDPAKTRQAFVHPRWIREVDLGEAGLVRAYRTGDLASCDLDGHVRILGRVDSQVKVHGVRVELGEIEAAVLSCASGVQVAAQLEVVVNKVELSASSCDGGGGGGGEESIVAFLAFGDAPQISPADITCFVGKLPSLMAARVPMYMVPNHVVALSRFPTTTAGKVDRHALSQLVKEPKSAAASCQSLVIHQRITPDPPLPPTSRNSNAGVTVADEWGDEVDVIQDARELALRDLWAEVLRIEDAALITRRDDFFMLGGESIRAIRLVAAAREPYGMCLTVDGIFQHPVLADMATQMSEIADEGDGVQDEPFDLLLEEEQVLAW